MTFLISRCWSSLSRIWNPGGSPASWWCSRSSRCAMPWKVPTHMPPPDTPSSFSMRWRISAAALLVKVTARMLCGAAPKVVTAQATRCVSTRVLPLPAPASTSVAPSGAVTAARCSSFSGLRIGERSMGGGLWPARILSVRTGGRSLGEAQHLGGQHQYHRAEDESQRAEGAHTADHAEEDQQRGHRRVPRDDH